MDPLTAIVTALSAGAAAMSGGALSEAGKDAYNALKNAVLRFVSRDDVRKLEAAPDSAARKGVVTEELQRAGRGEDPELAQLAQALVKALPEGQATGNISFKDIDAANITLKRMTAGGNISAEGMKAKQDFHASDWHAGKTER